ncbi:MAG TPA: hypothetical protein VGU22_05955 [Methylomirabilota bacterium]|jgi:hypothetical protein|nr:hypothetical protein [Methylomirabilota bacterium]
MGTCSKCKLRIRKNGNHVKLGSTWYHKTCPARPAGAQKPAAAMTPAAATPAAKTRAAKRPAAREPAAARS